MLDQIGEQRRPSKGDKWKNGDIGELRVMMKEKANREDRGEGRLEARASRKRLHLRKPALLARVSQSRWREGRV